jgi:hypothetical protein
MSGFAERELDAERLAKPQTSNSCVVCSELKACRSVAAVETAGKENRVIILRVEDLNRTLFVEVL